MRSVLILGRQPALGMVELESLFGNDAIKPVGNNAVVCDIDAKEIPFDRLGGSVKLAKILTWLDTTNWNEIEKYLVNTVPDHLKYLSTDNKLKLGLSVFGLNIQVKQLHSTGLKLKKTIREHGYSVRFVPNKTPALSSAQVIHNKLTGNSGWELLFIKDRNRTLLAQSVTEQDIAAYAARDQARPKRDARVGMLPPKLAQIIINLALGKIERNMRMALSEANTTINHQSFNLTLLDPFCGTGVVLQEALLMGFDVIGSDIDQNMVNYSMQNLIWLRDIIQSNSLPSSSLMTADATKFSWPITFTTVACETYLGRPFNALPKPDILNEVIKDVEIILRNFLNNIALQTKTGFRMCIAVPAWKTPTGFIRLSVLDSLEELGYNRIRFKHANSNELTYYREGQIVGRELVVLKRI